MERRKIRNWMSIYFWHGRYGMLRYDITRWRLWFRQQVDQNRTFTLATRSIHTRIPKD